MDKLLKSDVNFQRVRDGRNALPFYFDLDLSTARSVAARTHFIANVAGDSFYADANPIAGNCVVHFQDTNLDRAAVPFYVSPGFIANVPFTQMLIENAAQPGKKIRIVYGVDIDFQPGSIAQIAVTNSGGYTAVRPDISTGAYSVFGAITLNTPETVFTAAANTNGAILLSAQVGDSNAVADSKITILAKATAPANIHDGEVMLRAFQNVQGTTMSAYYAQLQGPQYIAAGKGLFVISNQTVTLADRTVRYKLL